MSAASVLYPPLWPSVGWLFLALAWPVQLLETLARDAGRSSSPLVSLVSVWGRNWCYLCEIVEGVAEGGVVEIASIHAVFMHVAENMLGQQKRLGEFPTILRRPLNPT